MASKNFGTKIKIISTPLIRFYHHRRKDMELRIHTGQVYDADDYRNIRFLNAKRLVNEKWGRVIGHTEQPTEVSGNMASCNGGNQSLGHPMVYYKLKPGKMAICFYCGQKFIKKN